MATTTYPNDGIACRVFVGFAVANRSAKQNDLFLFGKVEKLIIPFDDDRSIDRTISRAGTDIFVAFENFGFYTIETYGFRATTICVIAAS